MLRRTRLTDQRDAGGRSWNVRWRCEMTAQHAHPTRARDEVMDPVCGMTIAREDAVGHASYKGQTYYFCSQSCLESFQANPAGFIESSQAAAPATAPSSRDVDYVCPMDSEVRQKGPGCLPEVWNGSRAGGSGSAPRSRFRSWSLPWATSCPAGRSSCCSRGDRLDGSSSCWRRRWCSGAGGRSSCAAGIRS